MFHGVESLKLQYKGTQGYLKAVEKEQIIQWMRAQSYLRLIDSTINLLSDIPQISYIFMYGKVGWYVCMIQITTNIICMKLLVIVVKVCTRFKDNNNNM